MDTTTPEIIEVCIDQFLPDDLTEKAKLRARRENPNNIVQVSAPGVHELAADTRRCWKPGTELHVRFLGGSVALQQRVMTNATEWCRYANITFVFDDAPDAQIRISFDFSPNTGSWSRLGLDALFSPANQPTMNLGWYQDDTVFRRTVLHEFGHALGCIHEHQSPNAGIPWDVDKVIAYYSLSQNWPIERIKFNVLDRYSQDWIKATDFDPLSIMLYPIDAKLTKNGFSTTKNNELSDLDKQWIAQMYPFD